VGCAICAVSQWLMATLTLEADFWQVLWPRFVQGLGIGLTFVPLSTVALGAVPPRDLGHASGLFNFIRTLGGGVGIAAMATLLERGAQAHRTRLVGHVSLYEPEVWQRYEELVAVFAGRGADPATAGQQAWAFLDARVQRQALFLAFMDDFWRLAWIFAAVIPLLTLLGRRRLPGGGADARAGVAVSRE
jgi:DHA2 family multidrug resistance protein